MSNKLAKWAASILVAAGATLVVAFFLAWTRDWGDGSDSGLALAREHHWLYAIPVGGLVLALAAGMHAHATRLVAFAVGALVVGDFAYHLLRGMVQSNATTWLLLGGAATMLVGIDPSRRVLRAVGGIAVLLALFSPWESHAPITVSIELADLFTVFGIAIILGYVTIVASVVAIVSAFTEKPWGKTAALLAGVSVFVTYFWLLLAVANLFLGWGAWLTIGASLAALALAVLAPGERAPRAAT